MIGLRLSQIRFFCVLQRLFAGGALVSFLGFMLPTPAGAAVIQATYHGVIGNPHSDASGFDENRLFGPSGYLNSGNFDASFLIDISQIGADYPVLKAAITINGYSWEFPGYSQTKAFPDEITANTFDIVLQKDDADFFYLSFQSDQPIVFDQPLTGTGIGELKYYNTPDRTDVALTPTSASFVLLKDVPEPATGLMLLPGLVLLGAGLRRRMPAGLAKADC